MNFSARFDLRFPLPWLRLPLKVEGACEDYSTDIPLLATAKCRFGTPLACAAASGFLFENWVRL